MVRGQERLTMDFEEAENIDLASLFCFKPLKIDPIKELRKEDLDFYQKLVNLGHLDQKDIEAGDIQESNIPNQKQHAKEDNVKSFLL